jgi:hypothetical protein
MEDFDYIDALAKSELSGRTVSPSKDGWNIVQQKLQSKKKKRRLFLFLLLFIIVGSFGIYQGINFNSNNEIENNSVTNKKTEQTIPSDKNNLNNTANTNINSDSISTSTSDSSDASQAGTNISSVNTTTQANNQQQSTDNLQGSQHGVVNATSKLNSQPNNATRNATYNSIVDAKNNLSNPTNTISVEEEEEIFAEAKGLKIYPWKLVTPETLKRKRKKRKKSKKEEIFYDNIDIMVGLNGFFSPNNYEVFKSYVIELSYQKEKKLKNNYFINYGAGLQLRNLRFKNDSVRFNSGELSVNLFSSVEKKFGNYGVEAGAYVGYEIYSPNNKFFNTKVTRFFDQKINYGLSAAINYKKVGLIFKYELSPFVDELGNKKYGGFIIGVKYDF